MRNTDNNSLQKKLTITIDEGVYGYKEMAKDEARETEALEWSEATIGNVNIETKEFMSQELQLGKYESFPDERKEKEELLEELKKRLMIDEKVENNRDDIFKKFIKRKKKNAKK
jgi:hypothetical protein